MADLQDNWSLPENIRIEATDNNGIYPLAGRAPGNTWAYIDIYDEAGNKMVTMQNSKSWINKHRQEP